MMSEIKILPQITLAEGGPIATCTANLKRPQFVHLQQGSLDGACGPYCLCMALIALGFEKHTKLSKLNDSNSSRELFNKISDYSPTLIREGTGLRRMRAYAETYAKRGLKCVPLSAKLHGNDKAAKEESRVFDHNRVKEFAFEHFWQDHIVILASLYHWVMVVGFQYADVIDEKVEPQHFLVLDPSEVSPEYSVWNGVIDISPKGKGNMWFGSGNHAFYDALALWR